MVSSLTRSLNHCVREIVRCSLGAELTSSDASLGAAGAALTSSDASLGAAGAAPDASLGAESTTGSHSSIVSLYNDVAGQIVLVKPFVGLSC